MESEALPTVLILTPVKDAGRHLSRYVELIERLDWPRSQLSIGVLESDSRDATFESLQALRPRLEARAQSVTILKKDFGFQMPPGLPRWADGIQLARRSTLARSRNHLLSGALDREDWVLWIDVDVVDYPANTIGRLLSERRDILQPHCVVIPNGPTFDRNAWINGGMQTMDDLRGSNAPVRLDSVGGCMLLIRADLHRDGLVFPGFRYGIESSAIRKPHPVWQAGEIETEGLAMMARDMGHQCWGLPDFEILHAPE